MDFLEILLSLATSIPITNWHCCEFSIHFGKQRLRLKQENFQADVGIKTLSWQLPDTHWHWSHIPAVQSQLLPVPVLKHAETSHDHSWLFSPTLERSRLCMAGLQLKCRTVRSLLHNPNDCSFDSVRHRSWVTAPDIVGPPSLVVCHSLIETWVSWVRGQDTGHTREFLITPKH